MATADPLVLTALDRACTALYDAARRSGMPSDLVHLYGEAVTTLAAYAGEIELDDGRYSSVATLTDDAMTEADRCRAVGHDVMRLTDLTSFCRACLSVRSDEH